MKKSLALLLFLALFVCLGTSASAEGCALPQTGDVIYLGEYEGEPIRWLILDSQATNVGEPGMFLFSQYVLTNSGVMFNWSINTWKDSQAQNWCRNMLENSFTPQEQAAMPAVSKTEERFQQYGLTWGEISLEEEKLFFISSKELGDYVGPNDGDPGLGGYMANGKGAYYWLRTPHGSHTDYSGLVIDDNQVHDFLVRGNWGARPATNLNAGDVIVTYPDGIEIAVGGLGQISAPEDGVWKAALLDGTLPFSADSVEYADGQLTVAYSGAEQGQYISALLRGQDGELLSYGRLAQTTGESGSVQLMVDFPEGSQLYLFSERDNGAGHSNYASTPCAVDWAEAVKDSETPTGEENSGAEDSGEAESVESAASTAVPTAAPTEAPAESDALDKSFDFVSFMAENWMFAIPVAVLSVLWIVLAIRQAIKNSRRR